MIKETQLLLSNIQLSALEYGDRANADISLVFIHGWLDNAGSFIDLIENLKQQTKLLKQKEVSNWHFLAIDLAGHGLSQHRGSDSFYPFHDYIDDLHQLLTQISSKKIILVGHSLGALIASCYSAAFPENVHGLIQIEGLGPLSDKASNSVARLRNGILSRQRQMAKPIRGYTSRCQMSAQRMHANQLNEQQLRAIIERGTYQQEGLWYWRYDTKLRCDSLYRMTEQQALAYLSAISCPSLLILGDKGFTQLANARQRKQTMQCQKQVTVVGGHHCHLESCLQVSEQMITFIRQHVLNMDI